MQHLPLLTDSIVPGPGAWSTWGVFTALWAESGSQLDDREYSTQVMHSSSDQDSRDHRDTAEGDRRGEEMWSQDMFTSICELKLLCAAEWGWWLLQQTNWDGFGVLVDMFGWIWMGIKRQYVLLQYYCFTGQITSTHFSLLWLDQELDTHLVQQPV